MLLTIDIKTKHAQKRPTERIKSFGLDERGLQDILFRSLDRIFPDDELILLMQSRNWQEEPDLMAIDKNGDLFIFELKAWESHSSNLLQVLRYGQIFGSSKYRDLDAWHKKSTDKSQSLRNAHAAKFGYEIPEENFNKRQVFVVMTNGLDYRTREAIQYWRSCGLDVRPWVYRAYHGSADEMLLEISPFRVTDNPYEDIAEGYYILNTNFSNNEQDHNDMLVSAKAAAYFDPWKFKIERLTKGDVVFLYQSGVGVVAMGSVDGKLVKSSYHGNPEHFEEEYSMKLLQFQRVSPPVTAAEIKEITKTNYRFMSVIFGISDDGGRELKKFIHDNQRSK